MYDHSSYHHDSLQNSIRVNGEGRMMIQPDLAIVTLGVSTEGLHLHDVLVENAERINKIINTLFENGIQNEDIRSVTLSITPSYDYHEGNQIFRGFTQQHLLEIRTTEMNHIGLLVDKSIESGANIINSVQFLADDSSQAYEHALLLAVEDAFHKARLIAYKMGSTLHPTPIKVIEGRRMSHVDSQMLKAATQTTVQPGKQEITAFITAIFSSSI